jgi:AcrR family transcriptional regulator
MVTKGEETRERILDRAMALAAVVGLEGLSIGDLARETGMSKSGLFAHFESKEDLQLRIIETARERFIRDVFAPTLRASRGEGRVRALFERWLSWERGRVGGCPFVEASYELDDRPGPVRDALAAAQGEWVNALAKAVEIAIDEGHFRGDLDPRQFAYDMYGIFLAYHLYHRLLDDEEAADRARAAFDRLVSTSR